MLITVTTTSQSLDDILTDSEKDEIQAKRLDDTYVLTIQNLGTQNLWWDRFPVSIGTGTKTTQNGIIKIAFDDLKSVFLISETSNNTNIRIAPF